MKQLQGEAESGAGEYPGVYIKNRWYIVAASSEISRKPLRRVVLDEPLVIYRGEDGRAIVMDDTCPHRFAPLSEGKLIGDHIQCPYHGIEFAPDGKCVRIPGQSHIAVSMRVNAFKTIERYGWIWTWIGDQGNVDESLMPDWPFLDDPKWDAHLYYYHVIGGLSSRRRQPTGSFACVVYPRRHGWRSKICRDPAECRGGGRNRPQHFSNFGYRACSVLSTDCRYGRTG
jgi:nitrite reductase/ring-hydroxylating ferredoxin subunit